GTVASYNGCTRFEDVQPDVVLLDLESPPDESMSAAMESGGVTVTSALVILTEDPENLAADLLSSGVRAILPRDASPEEIVAAIQAAATGLVALHPDVFDSMLSRIRSGQQSELDSSGIVFMMREVVVKCI